MRTRILFLLLSAAGMLLAAPRPAASGETDNVLEDELTVKTAGLPVDGAGLLDFFRTRTKGEVAPDRLAGLVEQLGAKNGADREKACAELTAIGAPAIPALRQAASDPDAAEAAGLARRCLTALESNSTVVSSAAVRLIAQRKPDGATAALLSYLPYAEDESLQEEVKAALTAMAYHDGKADAALLKALADESPLRRSTAVDVLCQNGLAEPRDALRKLLADPKPTVKLRAALALAQVRDAAALDTLVQLLKELPVNQGRYAEEYLSGLAGDQSPKESLTDDASRDKVQQAWAAWWKSTEGTASLDEFTKRTLTEVDREKALKLIRQLGDDSFEARQKAKTDLKDMGVLVTRMLKTAVNDSDLEISQSARFVLQEIEKDKAAPLSPVAARVIALRKPPGAVEVLLAYLPFCDDEGMLGEVQAALNAVAYTNGQPSPALVKALEDKAAVRRGAAAEALCLGPLGENLGAVKKLLKDDEPAVRLQAALALAGGPHDREAVPVLIALVGELPADQSGQAEDYLLRMAAGHGPTNLPVGDGDARVKRRDEWAGWWKDNGERVSLVDRYAASAVQRYLGYTLLVQPNNSQIVELGPDGKERLHLTGLASPQDAVGLPGDRYLVSEFGAQRVSERNAKGDMLWQKSTPNANPQQAQRLPNGNTFIVCRNQILECTRDGKDVYVISRPNDVLTAAKLRNNEIVVISAQQTVTRLDSSGKELKSFRLPLNQNVWTLANDIMPNGHVLIAFQAPMNKVVEYDADGKEVWSSTAVMNPMGAARSPNGNTLIVSQQFPNRIVEVDKNNKQINEISQQIYTMRVHKR
jgi:HEAT repeat protein